jgi:hypothetical protein
MRVVAVIGVLAFGGGAAFAAQTQTQTQASQPPARPAPPYVVVQGQHSEDASPGQSLTVVCPANHRALGGGYSAVVRQPPSGANPKIVYAESGLDQVRSFPDMAGTGWQVSGYSPEAVRLKQPWRLTVRVVCLQVAG